jgi:AGCS family alanine or glycine:cation symporter
MGLLALVNLMVIMSLLPVVLRLLSDYRAQIAAGVAEPRFNADQFPDLDVDRKAWPSTINLEIDVQTTGSTHA